MQTRMGGGLGLGFTTARGASALDALLRTIETAGLLPKLSALWLPASATEPSALLNVLDPAVYQMTNSGATFTTKVGFTGNGTSAYINTGYEPFSDTNYGQDAAHIGLFVGGTNAQEGKMFSAAQGGTGRYFFQPRTTSNTMLVRFNSGQTKIVSSVLDSRGHTIMNRSGSTAVEIYKNGSLLATGTETSASKLAGNLFLLAQDAVGSSNSARTIMAAHVGASLSAGESATLNEALVDYLAAVGAIPTVDLILPAGQSNGVQGSASPPAPTPVSAFNYSDPNGASGVWEAFATTGFTASANAYTGTLWPAFANAWLDAKGVPIALVNYCRGSTSLLAAAALGAGDWSPTGTLRALAVAQYNAAIVNLRSIAKVRSKRVVWIQGENESQAINGTTITGALYQTALGALATYFDENITGGIDEMLVIQTGVRSDGLFAAGFAEIQQAQNDACLASDNLRLVNTDAKNNADKMADVVHYNQELFNIIGEHAGEVAASGEELAA